MTRTGPRRRLWGWYFFDWASQPYATLILTFVFGPYIAELLGDGSRAQAAWGWGIAAAGAVIAVLAPVLGALADAGGSRMRWIAGFSVLYVIGAAGLWTAVPGALNLPLVLGFFAIGLIGVEFATIFTNAMLPDLAAREEIGRVSGNGWAFGYVGGLVALVLMLVFFAENGATGRTIAGLAPAFGLDPGMREGTRAVGPLSAIWYLVFMVPFALWVRETPRPPRAPGAVRRAMADLRRTLASLPKRPSLSAWLLSSMLFRDALNGLYAFGGIYAAGVLGWTAAQTGVFGILAIISGAVFAWLGGHLDARRGPGPVIAVSIGVLTLATLAIVFVAPGHVLGIPVAQGSALPDLAFYLVGAAVGAAGGAVQAAGRTMMVRQAEPGRMTEAFGLYALSGKATSFVAPALVAAVTTASGSQQAGILPLIGLFILALVLLAWVKPEGDRAG